jgi:hypothetical protein
MRRKSQRPKLAVVQEKKGDLSLSGGLRGILVEQLQEWMFFKAFEKEATLPILREALRYG